MFGLVSFGKCIIKNRTTAVGEVLLGTRCWGYNRMVRLITILCIIVFALVVYIFYELNSTPSMHLQQFYRLKVYLTHKPDNMPVEIDMVIGCGSKSTQVIGESASSISIRIPNIYGIKLNSGEGVLVQTPDVCGEDPKEIIPKDFMPLVFYAPDADDLEFMIAHVSTISYDQEFSNLLFHSASVEEVNSEDFEIWQDTGAQNIIETRLTANGIFEGAFSQYYPPDDDIRYAVQQITCKSVIRVPILEEMRPQISQWWPENKPQFWMPNISEGDRVKLTGLVQKAFNGRKQNIESRILLGRDNDNDYRGLAGLSGIYNPNGQGGIKIGKNPNLNYSMYFGEALRIPYRTNTGYPWLAAEVKNKKYTQIQSEFELPQPPAEKIYIYPPDSYDYHLDTEKGADKGFAYCYRELKRRFVDPEIAYDSNKSIPVIHNYPTKLFVDDQLEISTENRVPTVWIEEDRYFLKKSFLKLHSLEARQDARYK